MKKFIHSPRVRLIGALFAAFLSLVSYATSFAGTIENERGIQITGGQTYTECIGGVNHAWAFTDISDDGIGWRQDNLDETTVESHRFTRNNGMSGIYWTFSYNGKVEFDVVLIKHNLGKVIKRTFGGGCIPNVQNTLPGMTP